MEYAHQHDIVHRDLKPANILVGKDGLLRVADFGLARRTDVDRALTVTSQVMGAPGFMPLEQAAGKGATIVQTLEYVQTREPVLPRQLNSAVGRDLETICLKCLEKAAGRRYETGDMLAEDPGRYLEGKPILARPIKPLGRVWRWCVRNP